MSAPVLIVGATGLLGPYLLEAFAGAALGAARTPTDTAPLALDCTDAGTVEAAVARYVPSVVILAAGLTNVDACEEDPVSAHAVNAGCAEHFAAALPPSAQLVYISTDQVYPDTPGPHAEGTEAPVNVYGESKLAGERATLAHPGGLALRTNLFGPSRTPGRSSLSDFVVSSLTAGKQVTLFHDIFFSPLHMATLAGLVRELTERGLSGVYNLGSRRGMSKEAFALEVARQKRLSTQTARSGSGKTLAGRARRPGDMRLDVSRVEAVLGRALPTLSEEIALL